mmetsp:Transcript_32645/g.72111  ORF Transcript_32645/g.72111 Transcript_32645/m.72111 type:complete len:85 (+) Transcript_32645:387-641(+)
MYRAALVAVHTVQYRRQLCHRCLYQQKPSATNHATHHRGILMTAVMAAMSSASKQPPSCTVFLSSPMWKIVASLNPSANTTEYK